jgi:hypothetical protein
MFHGVRTIYLISGLDGKNRSVRHVPHPAVFSPYRLTAVAARARARIELAPQQLPKDCWTRPDTVESMQSWQFQVEAKHVGIPNRQ